MHRAAAPILENNALLVVQCQHGRRRRNRGSQAIAQASEQLRKTPANRICRAALIAVRAGTDARIGRPGRPSQCSSMASSGRPSTNGAGRTALAAPPARHAPGGVGSRVMPDDPRLPEIAALLRLLVCQCGGRTCEVRFRRVDCQRVRQLMVGGSTQMIAINRKPKAKAPMRSAPTCGSIGSPAARCNGNARIVISAGAARGAEVVLPP